MCPTKLELAAIAALPNVHEKKNQKKVSLTLDKFNFHICQYPFVLKISATTVFAMSATTAM